MADSFLIRRGETDWSTRLQNRDVTEEIGQKETWRGRGQTAKSVQPEGYVSFQQRQEDLLFLGHTTLSPVQQTAGKLVCTVHSVFSCVSLTQRIITSYCYLLASHCGLKGMNTTDNTSWWSWKKALVWFHTPKLLSFTSSVSENSGNHSSWKEFKMLLHYCI